MFIRRFFDNLYVGLSNHREKKQQQFWVSFPHSATCMICGDKIFSRYTKVSPEQCGWLKVKREYPFETRKWICHQCACHRDFKPYIKMIDKESIKE